MRHFLTWFKEPLVHFCLLGIALFVYFDFAERAQESEFVIQITAQDIEQINASWLDQWQRLPTVDELEQSMASIIRDELYVREALRLELDLDDSVVRNRMIQKMRFLTLNDVLEPTQKDLTDWLAENQEAYLLPAEFSFTQLYVGREQSVEVIETWREQLNDQSLLPVERDALIKRIRQPLSRPVELVDQTEVELKQVYGGGLVDDLAQLVAQKHWRARWLGPVFSGFGAHLVKIDAYKPRKEPNLQDSVTARRVANDWRAAQSLKVEIAALHELKRRYEIRVPSIAP